MIQEILAGTQHIPDTVVLKTTQPKFQTAIATMEKWGGAHSVLGVPVTIHKWVQDNLGTTWYLLDYEWVGDKLYVLAGKGEENDPYLSEKVRLAREKVKEQGLPKNNPLVKQPVIMPNIVAPKWEAPKVDLAPTDITKPEENAGSDPA